MNKILINALVITAMLIGIGFLAAWLLPTAVEALPGQVRGRLPAEILRAVTTPLPTALPPPAVTPAKIETIVEAIATPTTQTESTESVPAPPATSDPPPTTDHSLSATRNSPTATPIPPTATPLPYPSQALLEGLEIVPQKLNNCGPATLSVNLNYYGLEQTQFDVAGIVKPRYDDRNVSPEELVGYANEYTGLRAALFRGGDRDLVKQLIAAGFPVVIEKGYEPDEWQGWMGHYLTLYGYDEAAQEFITIDTFLGPWDSSGRSYAYEEIESGWQQFNYTFYVVYEPDQEAALRAITGPVLNNEEAMWQQAVAHAQEQIEEEPQNAFAWFNLGSSLTNLGQLTADSHLTNAAATAFDQARLLGLPPRMLWYQFEPYEAYLAAGRIEDVLTLTDTVLENAGGRDVEESYLYRGHARLAQGDADGAAADYRRALELKPGYPAAMEALEN